MSSADVAQQWFSPRQAAERMGVCVKTVRRLIRRGCLRATHIGRVLRIRDSAIEETMEGEWLSPCQVASRLHLTEETVRRLIRSGKLAARKFGRVWRVRRSAIEQEEESRG